MCSCSTCRLPDLDGVGHEASRGRGSGHAGWWCSTSFSDRDRIVEALDAGAIGYLLKDREPRADPRRALRGGSGRVTARPEGGGPPVQSRRRPTGCGAHGRERAGCCSWSSRAWRTSRSLAASHQREDREGPPHEPVPADRPSPIARRRLWGRAERPHSATDRPGPGLGTMSRCGAWAADRPWVHVPQAPGAPSSRARWPSSSGTLWPLLRRLDPSPG